MGRLGSGEGKVRGRGMVSCVTAVMHEINLNINPTPSTYPSHPSTSQPCLSNLPFRGSWARPLFLTGLILMRRLPSIPFLSILEQMDPCRSPKFVLFVGLWMSDPLGIFQQGPKYKMHSETGFFSASTSLRVLLVRTSRRRTVLRRVVARPRF